MRFIHRHQRIFYAISIIFSVCLFLLVSIFVIGYFGLFRKGVEAPVVLDKEDAQTLPNSVEIAVEPLVQGLAVPWSILFTSKDRILVTERPGRIRIIENGQLKDSPLTTFTVSTESEEGLMGLAKDPDYSKNKYVYACYAYSGSGTVQDRVVRFIDQDDRIENITTLIDGIPAAQYHAGCRLGFGPDNKLYITTGDATNKNLAQNTSSLAGKILRINPDGSIPADNPYPGSAVWSYGHRNPQGIAWQPNTNNLFETEHGPSGNDGPLGGDEVNIITRGDNYGWPLVSHERTRSGTISPLLVFTPAVAPASAMFYSADSIPQFKGNFFFGGLRGTGIYRVILSAENPEKVIQYEKLPQINVGRIRDVVQGPDGNIYFSTSNQDGRGNPAAGDDKIYVIKPKK